MTVNIHGREYVQVHERLKQFHADHKGTGGILTELLFNQGGVCVFKATVWPDFTEPARYFTGHAHEDQQSSSINKTSFIENAETSAIGRALAAAGYGIDAAYASADEVVHATAKQAAAPPPSPAPRPAPVKADKTGPQPPQPSRPAPRPSKPDVVPVGEAVQSALKLFNGNPLCPKCGKVMKQRVNRQGAAFWGCTGYPQCRATIDDSVVEAAKNPPPESADTDEQYDGPEPSQEQLDELDDASIPF